MSLSKQAVADLAKEIRDARIMAFAYAEGERSMVYPCFVGALESTLASFVQQHKQDSTEIRAAFDYVPTDEEVRERQERHAKWRADYEARKASEGRVA